MVAPKITKTFYHEGTKAKSRRKPGTRSEVCRAKHALTHSTGLRIMLGEIEA